MIAANNELPRNWRLLELPFSNVVIGQYACYSIATLQKLGVGRSSALIVPEHSRTSSR